MPDLNVRGVSPELHQLLLEEARQQHRSLTALVIRVLEDHAEQVRRTRRRALVGEEMDRLRQSIADRRGQSDDSAARIAEDRAR